MEITFTVSSDHIVKTWCSSSTFAPCFQVQISIEDTMKSKMTEDKNSCILKKLIKMIELIYD